MPNFWKMQNKVNNSGENEAEILLYGDIGDSYWSSNQSKQFAEDLKAMGDVKNINVRINSPGGEVFAAQAIYSSLKRHPANKTVYIDGLAASAASFVAMVGNKVIMPENAMIMIHNPWSFAIGDSNEMRDYADFLDKIRDTLVVIYEEKTGKSRENIIELMDAETWMTAQEAKDLGFIDEIEGKAQVAASIKDKIMTLNGVKIDLEKYQNSDKLKAFAPENTPNAEEKPENTPEKKPEDKLNPENPIDLAKIKETAKNEGIKAERERIKAIDDLGVIGNQELINKAKFETFLTAEQTALEVVKAEKQFKANYLAGSQSDALVLNNIPPADSSNTDKTPDMTAFIKGFTKNIR